MIPTEMPTGRASRVEVSNAKRNGRLAGRLPDEYMGMTIK